MSNINFFQLHHHATAKLRELYEDKDNERKNEVQALSGPNEFSEFYARLKQIKEFYKKHQNEISVPLSVEFEELTKAYSNPDEMSALVDFTDEEGFGKYLDLNECYEKYLNIRGIEKVDYITYLMTFDHVFDIPKDRKNMEYKKYLETMIEYLHNYVQRIKPLLDLDAELQKVDKEFQNNGQTEHSPGGPRKQNPC